MSDERFGIGPDVARAATMPAWFYRSRDLFDELVERVLAPSWQCLTVGDALPEPGAVQPLELLPGSLSEPLLLVNARGEATGSFDPEGSHGSCTHETGDLRLLSNVCTHRGNLVCQHAGPARKLLCRYHGRRFALDGTLEHAPEFEGAVGFPSRRDDLPRLPLERRGPLLFTSLAPETPLDDALQLSAGEPTPPFPADVLSMLPSNLRHDPSRDRDFLVRAHWVLYIENFLEGFHVPYVHPGLAKALDLSGYETYLLARANVQLGTARAGELAFAGTNHAAYYLWLFPNTMVNVYPFGVSLNVIEPLDLHHTRVRFRAYVGDPALTTSGAGGSLDQVELEDESVVESEHRGLHSRLYTRGRYSPTRERGVHQLHRLLQAALHHPSTQRTPDRD